MERTSLITLLMLADAADYDNITLENSLPNAASLAAYFAECPLVLEKATVTANSSQGNHGLLINFNISVNTFRESTFHEDYIDKDVLVYLETSNGEKHFFGTKENPCVFSYNSDSGAALGDPNDNTLNMIYSVPKTA